MKVAKKMRANDVKIYVYTLLSISFSDRKYQVAAIGFSDDSHVTSSARLGGSRRLQKTR